MIKLFIFDMGGVLANNVNILPEAATELGLEQQDLLRFIEDDLTPLMDGSLSTKDFWRKFSAKSGISVQRELWGELFQPIYDHSTEQLIHRLKKTSASVVCGTNTLAEHYRIHMNNGDYGVFDRVYASHIMGIAKPDPAFFEYILSKEDVKPEEAVFTDDFIENVEAARSVGIKSFLFQNAETLQEEMDSAGVLSQQPLFP